MTGSGLVVLATNNTYTGGTTISAGTLQLGNGGTIGQRDGQRDRQRHAGLQSLR